MFIYALVVGNQQEHNKPTGSLDEDLKQWSHHSITASCFVFESAEEHGNRLTCSTALMGANLSIKQPWHTEYCHLMFSYSD